MFIQTVIKREIEETWEIEIADNDDPQDIFESIKRDPNSLWINYDARLFDATDLDETVAEITGFEVM